MAKMTVKEVADLAGISVRTLHYYDDIGLLVPDEITDSGYRLYSDENLETLQQILFFKELDFPLKEIKTIINSPAFDRQKALWFQRKMLLEKRKRIDKMISTIDKTIQHTKGDMPMSNKEKFQGFDFSRNPYENEVRKIWGDEAIDQTNKKINHMSKAEQKELSAQMNAIYRNLGGLKEMSPASDKAQAAIKEWYDFLNDHTGYHYSLEAFKGLGQMYVEDERFTQNIDQFGEGLTKFMRDAMVIFADNHKA